jgi:uncharacterized protein (UPF0332 family)
VEQVGNALEAEAIKLRADLKQADLFGRSAFNRYYYAVFYVAREMLREFSPRWHSVPHKSVPQLLTGQVREEIQKAKRRATKLGDGESVSLCSHALRSLEQLSELLTQGYSVRVTADYDPTITVQFTGKEFSLASMPVATAKKWAQRASFLTSSVRRAWKLAHES